MNKASEVTVVLLRVVSGLLLLQSGGMKMLDWFGGIPAEHGGPPTFASNPQIYIGGIMELVGGAALMIGLLTRPVAFLLSGMMAVAYFQFHQPRGTWPVQNDGSPAVLLCFIYLFFAAHGAGILSVDSLLRRPKS